MGLDAAVYARVSTSEQDKTRQVEECRDALDDLPYAVDSVTVYADVESGSVADREEFGQLADAVRAGDVDLVVTTEVSRLGRSGAQDVMEFVTLCLEHDTGVEFTQSPVSLRPDMDEFTQSIQRLITSLLSELAKVEREQKLERIQSGIRAAQDAGKWTGRPPRGFTVDEGSGRLRVEPEEFLRVRDAVERVVAGESPATVADDTGLPRSTVARLADERAELYLYGDADDDRVAAAVDSLGDLPDPDAEPGDEPGDEFDQRVREIVRDELGDEL